MKTQWYPIYDPELDSYTFIAPRTGHLISTQYDHRVFEMGIVPRLILGTSMKDLGDQKFGRAEILDHPADSAEVQHHQLAVIITKAVAASVLRFLPLSSAIGTMSFVFRPNNKREVNINKALELTSAAFGHRSNQNCLFISLCRYAFLRRLNVHGTIMLGTHVPTQKMHAWVQIGEHPILECPDVLVHYQSCVAYYAG